MNNNIVNPDSEMPHKYPVFDLWPNRCSQCGDETENASEFVVYTAMKGKTKSLGMRKYSTPYTLIQEHPCRVCETCKKQNFTGGVTIPTIVAILGGIFSCLISHSLTEEWFNVICISILLPIVIAGWWTFSFDKKRHEETAEKAASARGIAYVGLSSSALEEIEKSKDIPILK